VQEGPTRVRQRGWFDRLGGWLPSKSAYAARIKAAVAASVIRSNQGRTPPVEKNHGCKLLLTTAALAALAAPAHAADFYDPEAMLKVAPGETAAPSWK
jgi:hypothetical protein